MSTTKTDLSGKRILITGGLGFIGSNLAHRCLALGASVCIYDCLDPRSGGNLHNVHDIEHDVEVVVNDIRNLEGISAAVRGMDIVFNCAAYTSHPNSMKDPLTDIDVNCKGTINLLEAVRRFNPDAKVVHIGTSTQIGAMHYSPIDEHHSEFPVDLYSANKSVSEKYVLIYARAYGMRATVVRFANTFGPRSNIKSPEFGFINYFVGLGLCNKAITVFGEGTQWRNVTYVDDGVNALIDAALHPDSDGDVFFAVSDAQLTVLQIARLIEKHVGGSVQQIPWPKDREVIEIGDALISNAKIRARLGWTPQWDIGDGFTEMAAYFRPRLDKYL